MPPFQPLAGATRIGPGRWTADLSALPALGQSLTPRQTSAIIPAISAGGSGGHVVSPIAKRRPEKFSSRCWESRNASG